MKKIICILFVILQQVVVAQNLKTVDTIKISYSHGGTSFSAVQIYSKQEIFILVKSKKEDFVLSRYFRINHIINNGKASIDTIENKPMRSLIAKEAMEQLVIELQADKNNYNEAFLKPLLKITDEEIESVANKSHTSYKIFKYSKKDTTNQHIYTDIKNGKYLDEYLNSTQPARTMTLDAYNGLDITFHSKEEEVYVYLDFQRHVTGHFMRVKKIVKGEIIEREEFVNLNINLLIQGMLPKKSEAYHTVSLDNLFKLYIRWYLEKKV